MKEMKNENNLSSVQSTDMLTITPTSFSQKLQAVQNYMPLHPQILADPTSERRIEIHVTCQNDITGTPTLKQKIFDASLYYDIIDIIFSRGTYFGVHEMIDIQNLEYNEHAISDFRDTTINILGNGSTLIPSSRYNIPATGVANNYSYFYLPSDAIHRIDNTILLDANHNFITDFYGEQKAATGLIQIYVSGNTEHLETCTWSSGQIPSVTNAAYFRIPCIEDDIASSNNLEMFVQVYMWYYSRTYRVVKILNGWIYVIGKSIDNQETLYNSTFEQWQPNLHLGYGGRLPLYRLINKPYSGKAFCYVERDNNNAITHYQLYCNCSETITICNNYRLINANRVSPTAINISGFHFVGCEGNISTDFSLIRIFNSSNVLIRDCTFYRIGGTAITFKNSENIILENNIFIDYYRHGIYAEKCSCIYIADNKFKNGNLYQSNNYAIRCIASNYHILRNSFRNYGYSAIAVGLAHSDTWSGNSVSGAVDCNTIFQDPEYRTSTIHVPLMDSGAIYTFTKNTNTVIRHNFVSGHAALKDGRGIFCDDGSMGVSIFANMVINTRNMYSIDLYNKNPYQSLSSDDYNKNNLMLYNIIDGFCRFEGRNSDAQFNNYKGRNFFLTVKPFLTSDNIYNLLNSNQVEQDYFLSGCHIGEGGIALPHSNMELLIDATYSSCGDQIIQLSEFILSHLRTSYF